MNRHKLIALLIILLCSAAYVAAMMLLCSFAQFTPGLNIPTVVLSAPLILIVGLFAVVLIESDSMDGY